MGANASQLEKDIGSDLFPANEHYFGLVCITIYVVIRLSDHYIIILSYYLISSSCLAIINQFISVSTPSILSKDTFEIIMKCFFSGEFWEHLLLKLCAASTLLLQAVQGKGAVKGPDISLRMQLPSTRPI